MALTNPAAVADQQKIPANPVVYRRQTETAPAMTRVPTTVGTEAPF